MAACLELGGWLEWNSDADCCWDMREEMIVGKTKIVILCIRPRFVQVNRVSGALFG